MEGKVIIKGLRLTTNIAIQPQTFDKFEMGKGELGRDNGYFARQNWARLHAAYGQRFIENSDPLQWPQVKLFNSRIRELLEETAKCHEQAVETFPILKMNSQAAYEWTEFANYIEEEQGIGGRFEMAKDAASKAAENAARLAALIHLFQGNKGDITQDSMLCGARISDWYLEQFLDIFATRKIPELLYNAEKIDQYLERIYNQTRDPFMRKNELLKCGPVRISKVLNEALDILVKYDQIEVVSMQGQPAFIQLNLSLPKFSAKQAHRNEGRF